MFAKFPFLLGISCKQEFCIIETQNKLDRSLDDVMDSFDPRWTTKVPHFTVKNTAYKACVCSFHDRSITWDIPITALYCIYVSTAVTLCY